MQGFLSSPHDALQHWGRGENAEILLFCFKELSFSKRANLRTSSTGLPHCHKDGLVDRPPYNGAPWRGFVKAYTSEAFALPLPAGHSFPMGKYARLRQRVAAEYPAIELAEPPAASEGQLALVHEPDYIARVFQGRLSAAEMRAIGFPWSPALVERSRRSVGATVTACRTALHAGVAVNLAGGTHHAHRSAGAGYCVFNDVAVAARVLQADAARERRALRVAIIDLDVHQGDGTARIFAGDDTVFTLSMHALSNFPTRKQAGDLDIALPDGTGDDAYLRHLDAGLSELEQRFAADLIIYLAGADPHENDRLGRLVLTLGGLRARDERVFDFAERKCLPIAVTMAGGYGRDLEMTVAIHLQTVCIARAAQSRLQRAVAGRAHA
jgi:acetoin utilization deacetylase AcuC-like enzyme